jgi:octanoyl-[GcvH]:protein N-octanoyltransferase
VNRTIKLITSGHPSPAHLDTAISRATLLDANDGLRVETLRIHRPSRIVAFGRQDVLSDNYPLAVKAASTAGFAPVERLAGGRAAVFHEETIAFAWTVPEPDPKSSITRRFEEISEIVVVALRSLGVDASVGEIPGEYCPGAYSVHARSKVKLMGVGQRLTKHAAHVGGVIVVDHEHLVTQAINPVYQALGLDWEPSTSGSVSTEAPHADWETTADALVAAFSHRYQLEPDVLDDRLLERAQGLAPEHLPTIRANR